MASAVVTALRATGAPKPATRPAPPGDRLGYANTAQVPPSDGPTSMGRRRRVPPDVDADATAARQALQQSLDRRW